MMEATLKLYELLQESLGKERAKEFTQALEEVIREVADVKGQELKKEISSDLATKQDIKVLEAEIKRVEAEIRRVEDTLRAEIRRLEAYMKIMIILLLVAIALYSPVFAELVGRFLKSP